MATNQVTIKGVVEPQAVCTTIEKRTKRRAKVLSPLPAAEGEPIPEVVASQVQPIYFKPFSNLNENQCIYKGRELVNLNFAFTSFIEIEIEIEIPG